MAIIVRNTNYSGEVLEQLLTLAATSNEIVEKGLIMVIPGVEKKISLPRLKTSGANGSRRATWYSRNFRPKRRTPCLPSWPSGYSSNWVTTM